MSFVDIFSKNTQIPDFMKICLVGTELLHADGRKEVAKLIVAFRNFAYAPKNPTFVERSVICMYRMNRWDSYANNIKVLVFLMDVRCGPYEAPSVSLCIKVTLRRLHSTIVAVEKQ